MINSTDELRFQFPLKIDLRNIAIILFFTRTAIVDLLSVIGIPKPIMAIAISVLVYLCLFASTVFYKKTFCLDGIILIVFCMYFFKYTLRIHPEYQFVFFDERFNIYTTVFNGFTMMFAYYFVRMQSNLDNLIVAFKYIAIINFIGTFWQIFEKSGADYGMRFGYTLSFSAILFMYIYFKDSNTKYLFFSMISIFLAVVGGSRGTVLGYVVFLFLFLLISKSRVLSYKNILVFLSFIGIGILTLSKDFLMMIYNFFKVMGFESRTILMFIEGRALEQNGRDAIYYKMQQQIDQLGVFDFLGVFSDRYIMRGRFYAHNIAMESILTFGKFATTILFLLLIITFLYITVKYRKRSIYGLLLVFLSFSFSRLWVSSSFWIEPILGAYFALVVSILFKGEDTV